MEGQTGLGLVRAEQREIKQARQRAKDLWKAERLKVGHVRFTDSAALKSVGYAVERAWRRVEWRDIEAAIRKHAADEWSRSPWFLDSWALQERDARERSAPVTLTVEEQIAALRAARR